MHDLHFSWQGAGHAQCVTRVQRKRQKKKKKKKNKKKKSVLWREALANSEEERK